MFEGLGIGLWASISCVAACVWHTYREEDFTFQTVFGKQGSSVNVGRQGQGVRSLEVPCISIL